MVLEHVADHARLFEITRPVPHADLLGHRNLHILDVVAVPDRFEDRVGEPQDQDVLDGLLAQVVIDAIDLMLGKRAVQVAVERERGVQVDAERLLDDHPCPSAAVIAQIAADARLVEPVGDGGIHVGRQREVHQAIALGLELAVERGQPVGDLTVGVGIVIAAGVVVQTLDEQLDRLPCLLSAGPLGQRLAHPLSELFVVHLASRTAEHEKVPRQPPMVEELKQRGDQLARRQVTRRAEDDHPAGRGARFDAKLIADGEVGFNAHHG